jgi:hypothetical protein
MVGTLRKPSAIRSTTTSLPVALPKSQYCLASELLVEQSKLLANRVTGLKEQALLDSQCQELARQIEERALHLIRRYESGEIDLKVFEKHKREILGAAAAIGLSLLILSNFNPVSKKGNTEVKSSAVSVQPQVQTLFSAPAKPDTFKSVDKLNSPIKSLAELKALFADPKAPGAIAIGAAEGNYDSKGNRLRNWYGHSDPGDNRYNKGFCSIAPGRGDHFSGGTPEEADAACIRMLQGKLEKVFADFERAGAELTLERAINSLDLYNQASPDVSKRFPKRLVEFERKSSGVDLIADARTAAFYKGNRNTATGLLSICRRENRPVSDWNCVRGDQMRRAVAIRKTLNELPAIAPSLPVQAESKSSIFRPIVNFFNKTAGQQYSAEAIIQLMEKRGYKVTRNPQEVNIVHVRNGIEARDRFEDDRLVIQFDASGKPQIIGQWKETTKPGLGVVRTTQRRDGAITVSEGQWEYKVGTHYGQTGLFAHEALIQVSPSRGRRDTNRDGTPDKPVFGHYWTNIHGPWTDEGDRVHKKSAGCFVTRTKKAHQQFMEIVKRDRRYQRNSEHVFLATVINAEDL